MKQFVEMKFFFTGGRARWFFNHTCEEVKSAIHEHLQRLPYGEAVNSLFDEQAPASSFVLRRLRTSVTNAKLNDMYMTLRAHRNPACKCVFVCL